MHLIYAGSEASYLRRSGMRHEICTPRFFNVCTITPVAIAMITPETTPDQMSLRVNQLSFGWHPAHSDITHEGSHGMQPFGKETLQGGHCTPHPFFLLASDMVT